MATFRKRGKKWQAEVFKDGVRRSATFDTKTKAQAWAIETESQVLSKKIGHSSTDLTFFEVVNRFIEVEQVNQANPAKFVSKMRHLQKIFPFAHSLISKITTAQVAAFRDLRLQEIKSSSVRVDLSNLSTVFAFARRELKAIAINPVSDVKQPKAVKHRERRIPTEQEAVIIKLLGYHDEITKPQHETAHVFVVAIESAMRLGEILSIKPENLHLEESYVTLLKTKNGDSRSVPLSNRAKSSIQAMLGSMKEGQATLSARTVNAVSRNFDHHIEHNLIAFPELKDLTFHDTRHEATYRLSQRFTVLELAKITGHRDINQLLTYYNPTASELAAKLG